MAFAQKNEPSTVYQLMQRQEYQKAKELLEKSLRTNPSDELSLFNLGICQYQLKDFQAAANRFNQVSRLRGSYVASAHYYSALSYFNLNMNTEALKSAQAVSERSSLKPQANELIQAINIQSDENLNRARAAYADYENESCLVYLKDSLFEDHPKGIQLRQDCQVELDEEKVNEEDQLLKQGADDSLQPIQNANNSQSPHEFYLFADLNVGYDSNIYTSETAPVGKPITELMVGFEYLYKTNFDIGLGASYDHNNVVGVSNYQDSYINAYIPLNFYFENADLQTEAYTNITRANSVTSYTQNGLNLSCGYYLPSDFSVKLSTDQSQKKSAIPSFSYVDGSYSTYKGEGIYDNSTFKVSLMGAFNINQSEDLVLTGGTLPYAYRSVDAGLFVAYKFEVGRLSLSAQTSHRIFTNDYTTFKRIDDARTVRLRFDLKLSRNFKVYFENERFVNESNYDQFQIVNKNYVENVSRIGLYINN